MALVAPPTRKCRPPDGISMPDLPGLKAGVTADVAFQAGCTGFPDMRHGGREALVNAGFPPQPGPAAIEREDRFTRQVKGRLFACYRNDIKSSDREAAICLDLLW